MAKKCLIYETLNEVKTMTVKEEGDFMKLSGVFGVCGVRNNNHRVYETKNYKAMVDEMKKRIETEGCPGELEHPNTMNITLENISHKINSIDIDENGVVTGEITLLNTPKGKIAQEIVRGGLPLFISSRAQGNVDKNGNVTLEMLKTYDLVGSPGFSQAKLHLNESQICESLDENCFIIEEKDDTEIEENTTSKFVRINKNNNDNTIEEKYTKEEMKELQEALDRIEVLETELAELKEKNATNEKFDLESLANGIEKWIMEDYTKKMAEGIENWIMNDYSKQVSEGIENWVREEVAPTIEKWVVEDYSREIEKWVVEEYTPEIEKWVVEDYTPEICNGMEKWIIEEYSEGVDNWLQGEKQSLVESIKESTQKQISESKKTSLDDIDATLKMLEENAAAQNTKPVYKRVVEEEEPKFISEMPEESRVKWNLATEEVKESIKRRAKIYNFTKNTIQDFWESVNWQVAPTKGVYEGLENIENVWERNLRESLRRHRQF